MSKLILFEIINFLLSYIIWVIVDHFRAMRNRCIEIYMLGPNEDVDYNALDLQSLVLNAGIVQSSYRNALLEIYNRMSKEIITMERLSMVELLHTAFLVKQRLLRCFPAKESIRDICIDVYVKNRSMHDACHRNHLISLIDESIEQHMASDKKIISISDLDAATWSVKNLQDNSRLTIIRQQGLLLKTALKMYDLYLKSEPVDSQESDMIITNLLNDFCGFKENDEFVLNINVTNLLPYLLLNFYEYSSQEDTEFRKEWISKTLHDNSTFNELAEKNILIANEITSFRFRSTNAKQTLPWDLWRFVGKSKYNKDNSVYDANKLILLLHMRSMIIKSDLLTLTESLEDKNTLSVKEYSNALYHGKYPNLE